MTEIDTQPPAPARPKLRTILALRAWTWARSAGAGAATTLGHAPGAAAAWGADMFRQLADREPRAALGLVRRARMGLRTSSRLAAAEAVLTARTQGWAAAAPLFAALPPPPETTTRAPALLRGRAAPALDLALPDPDRAPALSPEQAGRIVVYTAAFGRTPLPAPVFAGLPGLRFLLLTDRSSPAVPGWETVTAAPAEPGSDTGPVTGPVTGPDADPHRAAERCRIRAAEALAGAVPEAEASLWIDPGRRLCGNLHTLLTRWCLPHDLVLWRHDRGIDWHDLAENRLLTGAGGARAAVLAQAQACAARGLPRDTGAWDTGMIWRRHGREAVTALMARWWEMLLETGGDDAIALAAVLADPPAEAAVPRTLPLALGRPGDNAFALRLPPVPPVPPPVPQPAAPGLRPARRRLAFVYAEQHATTASTLLRGRQLSEMVAARFAEDFEVSFTSDIAALRDSVLMLTKGALQAHSAETLADLGRRNAALLATWDDQVPIPDKVAQTDATLAISWRQTREMARDFPKVPTFYVTHHVNRQVRPLAPPSDRLRTGYFGDMRNTICPDSLGRLVEMVGTDTLKVSSTWIDALPRFNCHWIVRKRRSFDGAKPFLKGFLAARCGAVVVVARDEEDVLAYLGDDYPFFVSGLDDAALEADMGRIAAGFGGPEWTLAQAIMEQVAARSSDAVVCAEFRAAVAAVTA